MQGWLHDMEIKAGTEVNPVVGICRTCKRKIYLHELSIGASRNYCDDRCREDSFSKASDELYQLVSSFYSRIKLREMEA